MVEVIIAALLLTAVIGAIAVATMGGQRLQGAAKLQASITKAGQAIQEDLVSNRDWMAQCTPADPCDTGELSNFVGDDSRHMPDVDGKVLIEELKAEAIDSDVDGVGEEDRDGVTPDYFRITIDIAPANGVAERYGTTQAQSRRRIVTSIDRRGEKLVGSVFVEACAAVNQVDERMPISGCNKNGLTESRMAGCPPVKPLRGCDDAWSFVDGKPPSKSNESPFVVMERVSLGSFSLQHTDGTTYPVSMAKATDGGWMFDNIKAGTYMIKGLPSSAGSGSERWDSKEIPGHHDGTSPSVSVEPGVRARALVMFRPTRKAGVNFYLDRETYRYKPVGKFGATENVVPPMSPTRKYTGESKDRVCDLLNSFRDNMMMKFGCEPLPKKTPNCAWIHVTVTDDSGMTSEIDEKYWFCTFYEEWYHHKYYTSAAGYQTIVRPGPVKDVTYRVEPRPDFRAYAKKGAAFETGGRHCTVQGHDTGMKSGNPGCVAGGIDSLEPGLNTDLMAMDGGHTKNSNIIAPKPWVMGGAWWVTPKGSIRTPAGNVAANPTIKMRGKGECYWKGNYLTVEHEATECGRCNMVWKDGKTKVGACALLVETCVTRKVIEKSNYGGGSTWVLRNTKFAKPLCRDFSGKPWICGSFTPSVTDGNCAPPSPPSPVPSDDHPSDVTGGSADTPNHAFTQKPAVG